jgi:long-chain acyl-CoA synthetase
MLKISLSSLLLFSSISPALHAAKDETPHATIIKKDPILTFSNLVSMQEQAVERYADKPLFGTIVHNKYSWMTYRQFGEQVAHLRSGLESLGLGPQEAVAIIANNSPEWATICYATLGRRAAVVPMYTNQTLEEWKYKITDSGAKIAFVENDKIYDQVTQLIGQIPSLQYVVNMAATKHGEHTYSDLITHGKDHPVSPLQASPDDIMGFVYTSGTTGKPKGVLLSHENITSTMRLLPQMIQLEGERSLSFLPWSHIFGQLAELHALLLYGNATGFAEDRTTIIDDMQKVRPTILFSVPVIFNRIYDKVKKDVADSGVKKYFYRKWQESTTLKKNGLEDGPLDRRVGKMFAKKVRQVFGGKLKFAVSGGAKLDATVGQFVEDLGITVLEGYGMSETSGIISMNTLTAHKIGSVGKPFPGVNVEIDRRGLEDRRDNDGEIVVCGPNVMKGYHHLPEQTREVMTAEGCLRTGDLGHFDTEGFLFITGRVKEIYKMKNGQYVVPVVFENRAKLSPYFKEALLYGVNQDYNVAILVADIEYLAKTARKMEVKFERPDDLLQNPKMAIMLQNEVERMRSDVPIKNDFPKDFKIVSDEWTQENGMLTPTMKVKRGVAEKKYHDIIMAMYK